MIRILSVVLASILSSLLLGAEQPNVLIIMADDCTHNDLPLYGGQNAKTPNIDALAAQGLTFNKAYLCSAMCQPCRAELFSGQYPMRNGCAWNHSASRPDAQSMPQRLGKLGYRVGIAGKIHVKPQSVFPFQKIDGFDPSCVRDPTKSHDVSPAQQFMSDNSSPFCLVVALVEPHVPWVMGDPSQYPPAEIQLPPNIADTPRTRADFGRYLAEITYMDGQVGELLETLQATRKSDNTLVLFTSEQGSQFPGCKWTNWDTGLHTALIARWPGKIDAGRRTDALVQYCDVLPTLLDLAGGSAASDIDGFSFRKVFEGATTSERKFVYGMHNNLPEGPPYPIRTVTDGEFRYIKNLTPDELYIEKHLMGTSGDGGLNNPYWGTWTWSTQEDPQIYNLVKRYMLRPPEQLYHTANDSYEMKNLIADVSLAQRKDLLAAELQRWMTSQGDPGTPQDSMESLQAARKGQHRYVPE